VTARRRVAGHHRDAATCRNRSLPQPPGPPGPAVASAPQQQPDADRRHGDQSGDGPDRWRSGSAGPGTGPGPRLRDPAAGSTPTAGSAAAGSRVSTGAGRVGVDAPSGGAASSQLVTTPSEYVCRTVKTSRSVSGSGPRERDSSAGAPVRGAPSARTQVIPATTSVPPGRPPTGRARVRTVVRGAQSGTDIGYVSATGVASGSHTSTRVVYAGARSSGTRKVSFTAPPRTACVGVSETSAVAGAAPSAVPARAAATSATIVRHVW